MCAKLVLLRGRYESSKDALFELHWLPIKARINFKILCTMYNCFVGNAPAYLCELLQKPISNRTNLRSADNAEYSFTIPFNKRKTFKDRSFSTVGPSLWNKLPLYIRQSTTLDIFKRQVKTYYFRDFYALF